MSSPTPLPHSPESPCACNGGLAAWLGRTQSVSDELAPRQAQALAATLNLPLPAADAPLPVLAHWVYFTPLAPTRTLGEDGHPLRTQATTSFLPPTPLPRRMWAGGEVEFLAPLLAGVAAQRHSTVTHIETKQGRTGELLFVTVRHEISQQGSLRLREAQHLVYREAIAPNAQGNNAQGNNTSQASTGKAPPAAAVLRQTVKADAVLLFRYSALTFNSHRIHYDQPYTTQVEGYPGLVVHGPLLATLCLQSWCQAMPQLAARLQHFSFALHAPVFADEAFDLCSAPAAAGTGEARGEAGRDSKENNEVWLLWCERAGLATLTARATLRPDASV